MRFEIPAGQPGSPEPINCRLDLPAGGGARVLLYCHGFASSQEGQKAEYFRERALAAGLAFASFDFRGHGRSGGRMFDLTLDRNIEDLGLVVQELAQRGLTEVILLGSSMGAGCGLFFAARHPQKIRAAVHIAPALELDRGLLRLVGPEKAKRWEEEGVILFEHELGAYDLPWSLIENLRSHSVAELSRQYQTPTLFLQGMQDTSVSWRSVADFTEAAQAAKIELHLFRGGDHRLIEELPRMWDLLAEWLELDGLD